MPLEIGVWRIDRDPQLLETISLDQEERLEAMIESDPSIVAPNLLIIGRQVATDHGGRLDLLAMNPDGNLVVLELKRDMTPREAVAQLLDYGSWVRDLSVIDIANIYDKYLERYHPQNHSPSLDEAFCSRFRLSEMPDELNNSHELVIVSSALDPSTERIVNYLSEDYDVTINAVFFRVFKDGDSEYLTRAWLIDPTSVADKTTRGRDKRVWNGEFYVSYGHDETALRWQDGQRFGFIGAGGGHWYSGTLAMLEPGHRVWVNVPGKGYVGVGIVTERMKRADEFAVTLEDGTESLLSKVPGIPERLFDDSDDPEMAEYFVRVEWVKAVPLASAVREKGFFGNQNSVCKPTAESWEFTVDRLKAHFGIE